MSETPLAMGGQGERMDFHPGDCQRFCPFGGRCEKMPAGEQCGWPYDRARGRVHPWIFADIAREVYGFDLPQVEICLPALYADFVVALGQRFVSERRLGRLKEFTHYFAENYFFGHTLACEVQGAGSVDQAWQRACAFFQRNDEQGMVKAGQRLAEVDELLGEG